jgi:hypothetical protein
MAPSDTTTVCLRFARQEGQYLFWSEDGRISAGGSNLDMLCGKILPLVETFVQQGKTVRIEAHYPLGPAVRKLRAAGAVCRSKPLPMERRNEPTPRARWQMPDVPTADPGPPVYTSWEDYLSRTTNAQRMKRYYAASKKANRKRLLSATPEHRLTGPLVWKVIETARGRCAHCNSLAVENRPSDTKTGQPLSWAQVGRRIGSLEHVKWRMGGGDNDFDNLAWACLWCNTWPFERRWGATDHGGYFPED